MKKINIIFVLMFSVSIGCEKGKKISKIKVLSTAEILSQAIYRTFNNDSVSSLFN